MESTVLPETEIVPVPGIAVNGTQPAKKCTIPL